MFNFQKALIKSSCLMLLTGVFYVADANAGQCKGSEVKGGPCTECDGQSYTNPLVGICDPNMNCINCQPKQ